MKADKKNIGKTAIIGGPLRILQKAKIGKLHGKSVEITGVKGTKYEVKIKDKKHSIDPAFVKGIC